jgi:hypothetical protein
MVSSRASTRLHPRAARAVEAVAGDGALVEFASVVDAVHCSVDLQRAMANAAGDWENLTPVGTALIVIPHALTFSGVFAPTGLFEAGVTEHRLALYFLACRVATGRYRLRSDQGRR